MREPGNYKLLRDTAIFQCGVSRRPITYLEIGVNTGGSALAVLSTGVVTRATLIDNWSYGGSEKSVIEKLGSLAVKATILTGESKDILSTLDQKFDMIFVDGDHESEPAMLDMIQSFKLLFENGVMVVDDLDHDKYPFLRELVMKFALTHNLSLETHNVHTGVGVLRRK